MGIIKYNPNDRYKLNAPLLVVGVILGIILSFTFHSALLLILILIISQYAWLTDYLKRFLYAEQIRALDRLTNSANLADKSDGYSIGRYRYAVNYVLDMTNRDYYLLAINANGITRTRNLQDLANEVGAAFHHSANLENIENGIATYRINLHTGKGIVHDSDF